MKKLTKKDLVNRTLAYGEACACARAAREKMPSPSKITAMLCKEFGLGVHDESVIKLNDSIIEFGQAIYYYSGELSASPSKKFLVELLQRTEFYDVLEYIAVKKSIRNVFPYEIEFEEDFDRGICLAQMSDQIGQFGAIRISA